MGPSPSTLAVNDDDGDKVLEEDRPIDSAAMVIGTPASLKTSRPAATAVTPMSMEKAQPQPEPTCTSSNESVIITLESIQSMSADQLSHDAIRFIMTDQPADLVGSSERTETHTYSGYAGFWFRSYEHAAAFKSVFNRQFINVKLGVAPLVRAVRPASVKKDRTTEASVPTRSSRRLAKLDAPEPSEIAEEVEENDGESSPPPVKRARKFKSKTITTHPPLTTEQLAKLQVYCETHDDSLWLEGFDSYLDRVEQISAANKRNVLRQAKRLVLGQCIEYSHWPEGVAFNQARVKVHLGMDLVQLLSDADDFEREHGRDLGNGWLMRHPIQKLINYQRHLLEELEQPGEPVAK